MTPLVPRFGEDNLLPGQILRRHDEDNAEVLALGELVCDFCQSTPVVWLYGCADVTIATTLAYDKRGVVKPEDHKSDDEWAACADCKFLVDRSEVKKLADRGARRFLAEHGDSPPPLARMRRQVMEVQQAFWKNRRRSEDRPYAPRTHSDGQC